MIRVLVVDDHAFFRGCLVSLIGDSADFEVVGECADGVEVVEAVAALRPDIVLMDVQMTTMSGIEAMAMLHREDPSVRVVMLTSDVADSSRAAARGRGAMGYLVKGCRPALILAALRRVALGGTARPEDLPQMRAEMSLQGPERRRVAGDQSKRASFVPCMPMTGEDDALPPRTEGDRPAALVGWSAHGRRRQERGSTTPQAPRLPEHYAAGAGRAFRYARLASRRSKPTGSAAPQKPEDVPSSPWLHDRRLRAANVSRYLLVPGLEGRGGLSVGAGRIGDTRRRPCCLK
ncbi:DNA-binding response regulator, NarL/FixJ family, contains REC and HTH domains [Friedmanniella luteola]|uniref:DNA-binding response regulator, NarL/FixJ family, contains REC and HTH domains n=1 Tax=Friedmanniella luteola TaxID=546871 RepID=A0A1H1WQY4_9ACTN|nr:DNA-binding response regulator, NarL/FixJ family, contains REC and HTH domains [Friedmanniella luteola]